MMEGLQISIPQRMILLRITLVCSLVISVLLSLPLWGGYREVPYAPVFAENPVRGPFDLVFIAVTAILWIGSLFLNAHRLLIALAFLFCIALVLFDINRLQPWFYVYNAMLCVFIFYNGRVDDSNRFTAYFILLQIIFASVYFFCGLSQLNKLFIDSDFTDLISPLTSMMSERQFLFFKKMGSLVPYLLMFIGLAFVISPIRYLAITLATLLHLLLLILLFPSAKNQNYALWFSNLSFIVMLILLFSGKTKQRYFSPTFLFQIPFFYIVILLFVILPFFNNSGKWPDFLSSNFKSGNVKSAQISLSEKSSAHLPVSVKYFCYPHYGFLNFNYKAWYLNELHADCYPAVPVFNSIYNYLLAQQEPGVKEIELQLLPKQKLLLKP